MKKVAFVPVSLAIGLMLVGCGQQEAGETETMEFARPEVTTGLPMVLPVTTSSDAAKDHFMQGQRAMDMGRIIEANAHFKKAVEADSGFARAHLNIANTSLSLDEFTTNLDLAVQHAEGATEAERLLIEISQKGFGNDVEGQLRVANELVATYSTNPRAWLTLAGIQTALNNHAQARASMMKAADLAPDFVPAYVQLGNSYLFGDPKDFSKAEEHIRWTFYYEPDEPLPYDLLGDMYRAQGKLENARDAYTRSAELDPDKGLPLQQRGDVNSFLGDYDAARADYDAAIALGRANEGAGYAVFRAFIPVHAGTPQAAIDELHDLVESIDEMGIPEPAGLKINALTNVAIIAMHHGNFQAAEQALEQRTVLMMQNADKVGTPQFRRSQEANIAYFGGMLAARKGEYATAKTKADECAKLVEPDANPRKMEPVHEVMGLTSLLQGNYEEAVAHYEQANLNNIYTMYHLALAHEGGGNTEEAKKLFREVADYNFNSVGFALVRKEAMQKLQ